MFRDLGYTGSQTISDADLVCFTGGEDVNPELYGEKALQYTRFSSERDAKDKSAWEEAWMAGIPCVGICRGGQFLNVMNDGTMWQHVDGHQIPHHIFDVPKKKRIFATSTHHQAMIPGDGAEVVAVAAESLSKTRYGLTWNKSTPGKFGTLGIGVDDNLTLMCEDIEALWYPDTQCLCFQPHPEYPKYGACTSYFGELLDRYINKETECAA